MARLRVSRKARAELDSIWFYIARQSGSSEVASHIIDSITGRFWLFSRYRVEKDTVVVHHILHGSRDIAGLLG